MRLPTDPRARVAALVAALALVITPLAGASAGAPAHRSGAASAAGTSSAVAISPVTRAATTPAPPTATTGTARTGHTVARATPPAARSSSTWAPRPAQYPRTVVRADLPIPMSDGTVLRGDLMLPAGADGKAVAGRFPVVVTITAYNKDVQKYAGGLAGGDPSYLVERGYAQLTVDARGTGSSPGRWCAFCARENKDSAEVMAWAHRQPWSDGRTAMAGPSYMGINQIFAAAGRPPGLKAIFPQVPAGDVYRDVVASGGQLDVGFIPLWLGLVTVTGVIPPATTQPTTLSRYLQVLLDHVAGALTFTAPLLTNAVLGGQPAYDGPFYRERSPLTVVDDVDVPTFLVSGEFDLFQRGTPMLFDRLQRRGVPTKLVIGPWNHLQASGGTGFEKAGYGSLQQMQLRWFDHYVRGVPDATLDKDVAPLTYYEQGTGAWRTSAHWLGADRTAVSYRLSGSARTAGPAGALTRGPVQAGTADLYPVPVAGLCTRSLDQWTAGIVSAIGAGGACLRDNKLNDKTGVVFRTAPLTAPLRFQGPINAHLNVSSTTGDGMLSVAVEDEAPDGTVTRLTGGWQVISFRALDRARSRYLDGQLVQPYHPFTRASRAPAKPGQVVPVDVEVFPTGAEIRPGHRLRIAVQAFDVPHLLPSLPDSLGTLTVLRLHQSAADPAEVTLPVVR
jgi:putative CocE/NonD family hydrolase